MNYQYWNNSQISCHQKLERIIATILTNVVIVVIKYLKCCDSEKFIRSNHHRHRTNKKNSALRWFEFRKHWPSNFHLSNAINISLSLSVFIYKEDRKKNQANTITCFRRIDLKKKQKISLNRQIKCECVRG